LLFSGLTGFGATHENVANLHRSQGMSRNRLVFAFMTAAILAACNIFNPDGRGDAGNGTDANLSEGEALFRAKDFGGSMNAFAKAIKADSTNSLAYYGYSKAVMRYYQLNASSVLEEFEKTQGGASLPFIDEGDSKLTRYLQATSKVRQALSKLTMRDTLSRWYGYLKDSTSVAARNDSRRVARIAFIQNYLEKSDQGQPGFYPRSKFPLSDRKLAYEKVVADYGFTEMIYAVIRLRDLDGNDTIDTRDDLLKKLNFNINGGLSVENLSEITEDLKSPENRENINKLIQNVSGGLGSASTIVNLLTPMLAENNDSLGNAGLSGDLSQEMDSVLSSIGSAVTFYQFGDGIDNDGDGCVDEEIMDGRDNDGDGLTDEDARIEVADGIDNDHDGVIDEADELPNPLSMRLLFTENNFQVGPSYMDKKVRVEVQADSLATKTSYSAGQLTLLQSAQTRIGGCWNAYP
jgi:hypothetical protein